MAVLYGMTFNARMRSLIAETIDSFLKSQPVKQGTFWEPEEKCVAVQIRRGDRLRGVTMDALVDMCAKWEKDKSIACLGGNCGDLGCGYPKETWWVGLTMDRYLKRAEEHFKMMGGGSTIFVMTVNS